MKKLLRKRSMLLVAFLVSLCVPTMAQKDYSGAELNDYTVYYLRNVGTGLYLKYGAESGMHATEGVAAHPIMLDANGDGTYAIASTIGYLASLGGSGYMDLPKAESKWRIESVGDGDNANKCYLWGNGLVLASCGNAAGSLYQCSFDSGDKKQQWEFVKETDIRPSQAITLSTPLDLTSLIKASSFDLADGLEMIEPLKLTDNSLKDFQYRNKWLALDADDNVLNGAYSWWTGWIWEDVVRDNNPSVYNNSGVLANGVRSAFTFSQNIGTLPAGTYTLSFEGFSRILWELKAYVFGDYYGSVDYPVYVEVVDANGNKLHNDVVRLLENTNILENGDYHKLCIGGGNNKVNGLTKAQYAATEFRDNDNWKQNITFTIPQSQNVKVRLRRPDAVTSKAKVTISGEEYEVDLASKAQCFVAFDNFTLLYHGNTPNDNAWPELYYDRVKTAYLHATSRLCALAGNSYENCSLTGCVHWTKWDEIVKNVLTVNGVHLRGATAETPAVKEAKLNNNVIDTEKEYLEALAKIEAAYQAALKEHNKHLTDFTGLIINPSFEDGEYNLGWSLTNASISNANIRRYTKSEDGNVENVDDTYYFYSNHSEQTKAPGIVQTVAGLAPGLYRLEAYLTAADGNYVYLRGNNQHNYIIAKSPSKLEEVAVDFLVGDDGKATIGAVGGNNRSGRDTEYKYYYPEGGCPFKADDFQLTYICDLPNGKLRLALDEAWQAYSSFDAFGQNSGIVSKLETYENYYLGLSATAADVDGFITDIRNAMNAAAKAQSTFGADMTYAIVNPNFEWNPANYDGWTTVTGEEGEDTKVAEQNDTTYMTAGADGGYLFNTWLNKTIKTQVQGWFDTYTAENVKETSDPLIQTITDLPNGTYELQVMVASHHGEKIEVTANDVTKEVAIEKDKTIGEFVILECKVVNNGTLKIEVAGKETTVEDTYKAAGLRDISYTYKYRPWFKADNFRLTLLEPDVLNLDEMATFVPAIDNKEYNTVNVNRSIANTGNWSTFVLPFDANANALFEDGKCVVKKLESVEIDETGEHVSLKFGAITNGQIEARKPYIIKNESGAKLKSLSFTDVTVNTIYTTDEQTVSYSDENGLMKFHGVYHRRPIPQGTFFINSNKFYEAVGPNHPNPDMISGFRGYFELLPEAKAQGVRAFSFRIGEDETAIEDVNNEPATVVAIYNLNGMRLDDMQEGVNILQMSNGTSIKVVIE